MITFTNPRTAAYFSDWPIGGKNRGKCVFDVVTRAGHGQRVVKRTTNKHGAWCAPKNGTYAPQAIIVDGNDDRIYILTTSKYSEAISVSSHDFMSVPGQDYISKDANPEQYAELVELFNNVKECTVPSSGKDED